MKDKFCPTCMGTGKIYKIKNETMNDETTPCPDCNNHLLKIYIILFLLFIIGLCIIVC
jgi:ribosomal protein S27AE